MAAPANAMPTDVDPASSGLDYAGPLSPLAAGDSTGATPTGGPVDLSSRYSGSSFWTALLGDNLLCKPCSDTGSKPVPVPTSDALRDAQVISLYFSASWCSPCQEFTPQLADAYARVNDLLPPSAAAAPGEGKDAGGDAAGRADGGDGKRGDAASDPAAVGGGCGCGRRGDAATAGRAGGDGESAPSAPKGCPWRVVLVSRCSTQEDFDGYYGVMPWHAVAFGDKARRDELWERFQGPGVPTLVMLNAADGSVLCRDAVGPLRADPRAAAYPWNFPHARELCSVDDGGRIVSERTLLAFIETEDADKQSEAKLAMEMVAQTIASRHSPAAAKGAAAAAAAAAAAKVVAEKTCSHGKEDDADAEAAARSAAKAADAEAELARLFAAGKALPQGVVPALFIYSSHSCTDSLQVRMACGLPVLPHPCELHEVDEDEIEERRFSTEPLSCSGCRSVPEYLWRCEPCNFNLCEYCISADQRAKSLQASVSALSSEAKRARQARLVRGTELRAGPSAGSGGGDTGSAGDAGGADSAAPVAEPAPSEAGAADSTDDDACDLPLAEADLVTTPLLVLVDVASRRGCAVRALRTGCVTPASALRFLDDVSRGLVPVFPMHTAPRDYATEVEGGPELGIVRP